MSRPTKHRMTKCSPVSNYFKPRAIPMTDLDEIILEKDELESIRLADFMAFSHEESAVKMKISRATYGRILEKARFKISDAIINGKAIKIS